MFEQEKKYNVAWNGNNQVERKVYLNTVVECYSSSFFVECRVLVCGSLFIGVSYSPVHCADFLTWLPLTLLTMCCKKVNLNLTSLVSEGLQRLTTAARPVCGAGSSVLACRHRVMDGPVCSLIPYFEPCQQTTTTCLLNTIPSFFTPSLCFSKGEIPTDSCQPVYEKCF